MLSGVFDGWAEEANDSAQRAGTFHPVGVAVVVRLRTNFCGLRLQPPNPFFQSQRKSYFGNIELCERPTRQSPDYNDRYAHQWRPDEHARFLWRSKSPVSHQYRCAGEFHSGHSVSIPREGLYHRLIGTFSARRQVGLL